MSPVLAPTLQAALHLMTGNKSGSNYIQYNLPGPDEIKLMTAAYEGALIDLDLKNRDDPLTEIVASTIITVTSTGERDPMRIKERALHAIGCGSPDGA
jgi:hypothetical protein